jgi:hypothetical protein
MTDITASTSIAGHAPVVRPRLETPVNPLRGILFVGLVPAGVLFGA